jgi:hypothetical protein
MLMALLCALIWSPRPASAAATVEERLDRVEEEITDMKQGAESHTAEEVEEHGSKISFHGYGELHFNRSVVDGSGFPDYSNPPTLDFHRLVLGWSYAFTDRLGLHVELDFEHAAQEIELEFAYLEYLFNDAVHVRVGSMLMPVGPLNEFHEPTHFYSVERPYVQRFIIPTSWQTGGVGLLGQVAPGLRYRIYFVQGLDATGFTALGGIKGGRQVLSEDDNRAFDFGGVGRLEYTGLPGFALGASLYSAGAGQDDPVINDAQVTLWDVDVRYRIMGIDLTGVYARTHIGGADRISAVVLETIGSRQYGWYVEGAYHVDQLTQAEWDLVPFVRFEMLDTQADVPAPTPGGERQILITGVAFFPHPDVAVKADLERWRDDTGKAAYRYNLGIAFEY